MSDHSRYEETDRQFHDLSLPDEDASWQKMKELLDKDDDDDRIVPPVLLRSCLGWGIVLLAGLAVAWFLIRPEKWWSTTSKTHHTSSSGETPKQVIKQTTGKENTIPDQNINTGKTIEKINALSKPLHSKGEAENLATPDQSKSGSRVGLPVTILADKIPAKAQSRKVQPQTSVGNRNEVQEEPGRIFSDKIKKQDSDGKADSSFNTINPLRTSQPQDSTKVNGDTQPKDSANQKKVKRSQKKLLLTAGIGEQQLIPIAGQTAVPYSRYGRKGSLGDYVPSVFVQLQKEKKWFIQSEFRYGAAQSVKEFLYNRQTRFDSLRNDITITTLRLKKTYYHQLPVSFNYYLEPNLSVGIGGMYSCFYGAITEKETTTFDVQTQTVTTFKQIIPIKHFTDSFLYKTQVHILVQANYQWKKFSFGLRYAKDIQPYIRYTRPDGTVEEEKNQSLEFMIRYRLWQSKQL